MVLLTVTVVTFFAAPSGKINNFPTYLLGLWLLVQYPLWVELLRNSRVLRASFALLAFLTLSVIWSPAVSADAVGRTVAEFVLVCTFLVAIADALRRSPARIIALLSLMLVAALLSALYSLYRYHFIWHSPIDPRLFSWGRLLNPVLAALIYSQMLLAALVFFRHSRRVTLRLTLGVIAGVLAYAVFMTGTRGVWLGVIPALAVLAILFGARPKRTWVSWGVVAGTIAIMAGYWLADDFFTQLWFRGFQHRPAIWAESISRLDAVSLLVGQGVLASAELTIGQHGYHHAHSLYLSTVFYGGLVALVLLLALASAAVKLLWSLPADAVRDVAIVSLVLVLLSLLVDGDRLLEKVSYIWIAFWLPFGLVAGLECRIQGNKGTATNPL